MNYNQSNSSPKFIQILNNKTKTVFFSFVIIFIICLFGLITGLLSDFVGTSIPTDYGVSITGNVSDVVEAKSCLTVLVNNYQAVNQNNMEKYLLTIVPSKRQSTKIEIQTFFNNYKLNNSVEQFKILWQNTNNLQVQAAQKSILVTAKDGASPYKNHISQINYDFVKTTNQWYIDSSVLVDNYFI
ncbi:MAG: hypothetical protein LBT99_00010 [Bifidobacteriaceae bacterium]|jgi:hypothetical protein|nr:hypothetical protein [Bifidobacteriaceae bacterium]